MAATSVPFKVALIIPMYNAKRYIEPLFKAISQQSMQPDHILVIDSSSTDGTGDILKRLPVTVHTIPQWQFDHGGTRKLATTMIEADIYLFMTQDAIPAESNTFANLINAFTTDSTISCAYGRQLPLADASPLSAHARYFNYPAQSSIKRYVDRNKLGIKTCFNSDSFAAYRKVALDAVGNFPAHLITGEDAYIAGKLVMAGYAVAYVSDAKVWHSHNLSLVEEFHRYFSIGVFHHREFWIIKTFKSATGEGLLFVRSELTYLLQRRHFSWIPRAILSTFIKYFAYQLGLHERIIPLTIKRWLGVNRSFWHKSSKLLYDN